MIPSYAVLAAGNFWELQKKLEKHIGIISTLVGYTGGQLVNPNYQQVAEGNSGHLEAVKIAYDQNFLNYEQLLDIFYQIHDPCQMLPMSYHNNKLFASTIFYLNNEQKKIALNKQYQLQQKSSKQILTQIRALKIFYPAEPYHQHFEIKPGQTSCCLSNEC